MGGGKIQEFDMTGIQTLNWKYKSENPIKNSILSQILIPGYKEKFSNETEI